MSEINRNGCAQGCQNGSFGTANSRPDTVCERGSVLIDTYQVFDSCRDRDCFENIRVFLDEFGQSLIEHTGQVRIKSAEICSSAITVEPVQLSRGYFRITVRFYVKVDCEACVCPGKSQSFAGIAVTEKSVVLYGGEGEVRVFRSNAVSDSFCSRPCQGEMTTNLPTAVVEVVDPVILGAKVVEYNTCSCGCNCCCCEDIPDYIGGQLGGAPVEPGQKVLEASLGFFSVIRLERPEQYLVSAVEFSVPDKECAPTESGSPCDAFARMAFPIEEFAPGRSVNAQSCGCSQTLGGVQSFTSSANQSDFTASDCNCGKGQSGCKNCR